MTQQQSRLPRHLWLPGIAIAAALSATVSHARGSIESVTGFLQGGAEVLRIEFSEPQTELPTGFAVQTPARIALDLPGVTNASGRSLVEINQGNVNSAHIVEAGERSRIVLNLKQATTYRAELHDKQRKKTPWRKATDQVFSATNICCPNNPPSGLVCCQPGWSLR